MKNSFLIIIILFISFPLFSQVEEKPAGKISGLFFMDYYYNLVRDDSIENIGNTTLDGAQNVNGFRIRRIYLTYDYRLNSKLSSRLRLESDEENFTTSLDDGKANKFSMFIKDAYINWSFTDGHNVIMGIQPTPAFETSENIWGNRYIEKTIMDLRKIVPSRDLAISFKGKLDSGGLFKYWLMYGNNSAGKPENNKYKRYFAHLEVNPVTNLKVTLYTDYQSRESVNNQFVNGGTLSNNIITSAFFAGYSNKDKFSAGIELYHRIVQNGDTLNNSYINTKGFGISLFSTYHFNEKINVFARFDNFEPNSNILATGDIRNLVFTGVAFKPDSRFIISPNVIVELIEKGDEGSIKSSVTTRLTASWVF